MNYTIELTSLDWLDALDEGTRNTLLARRLGFQIDERSMGACLTESIGANTKVYILNPRARHAFSEEFDTTVYHFFRGSVGDKNQHTCGARYTEAMPTEVLEHIEKALLVFGSICVHKSKRHSSLFACSGLVDHRDGKMDIAVLALWRTTGDPPVIIEDLCHKVRCAKKYSVKFH